MSYTKEQKINKSNRNINDINLNNIYIKNHLN